MKRTPTYPCIKLVRIILETWDLVRKYTLICSFRKHIFQYQGFLTFADVTMFLAKISIFSKKNSTFTQGNSVRAVLEIFKFCFNLLSDKKVTINENISFTD